jgi:hypothetical protein
MAGRQKRARLRLVGAVSRSALGGGGGSIVVLPGDVKAIQGQIKADLELVRTSLQRCATSGTFSPTKTPSDWDSWQSMKARAEAYIAESPSFLSSAAQYERGEAVQKELATWHDRAKGLGCDAGPAPTMPDSGPSASALFGGLSTTALLVLAVMFAMRNK